MNDKRPEVIAALVAAELVTALLVQESSAPLREADSSAEELVGVGK